MTRAASSSPVRGHHPDYLLALGVFVLLAIGLILIYSISPILSQKLVGSTNQGSQFLKQIVYLGVGIAAWIFGARLPYRVWQRWAPWLMGASIILLALLFTPLHYSALGATRWLRLGPITIQPAEVLKLSLIIYLASWFERRGDDLRSFWDGVMPFMVMVALASIVVAVFQKDMGTTVVILASAIGMYFAAGLSLRHFAIVGLIALSFGALMIAAFPHRMSRVTTFMHLDCSQSAAALGDNYHACQALIAIGSGGLSGVGLGHSVQVYGYLPEAATDSIFAIIGEEFGLLGALVVIALFGFVVYRGLQVARDAPDTFSRLVATGISLWLLLQAAINIGAMISLVPLTGIPLPFISYGGSSMVISLLGVGILLQISKFTVKEASHADNRERRGNRRPYFANPGNGRRTNSAR